MLDLSDEALWGSSPRVRGKHGRVETVNIIHRLIPARAGKT